MQNQRIIKIIADASNFDAPVEADSSKSIKIRQADDICIDVVLLKNTEIVSIDDIDTLNLEIIDIGNLNAPSPRTQTLLLNESLSVSDLQDISADDYANGSVHATFTLSSAKTNIASGEKWFRIFADFDDDTRTTFSAGWIHIEESFGSELNSGE